MNEIIIKIVGYTGSGKSTIGDIILNALRRSGIDVIGQYLSPLEYNNFRLNNLDKRIAALKEKKTIVFVEEINAMERPNG